MVELLHVSEERIIIRTKDGKILQVLDDVMKMKFRRYDKNVRRNFWFHDIIAMSDLLKGITTPEPEHIIGWDIAKAKDFTIRMQDLPELPKLPRKKSAQVMIVCHTCDGKRYVEEEEYPHPKPKKIKCVCPECRGSGYVFALPIRDG